MRRQTQIQRRWLQRAQRLPAWFRERVPGRLQQLLGRAVPASQELQSVQERERLQEPPQEQMGGSSQAEWVPLTRLPPEPRSQELLPQQLRGWPLPQPVPL